MKAKDNNHYEGLAFIRNEFQKNSEIDGLKSELNNGSIKMRILD